MMILILIVLVILGCCGRCDDTDRRLMRRIRRISEVGRYAGGSSVCYLAQVRSKTRVDGIIVPLTWRIYSGWQVRRVEWIEGEGGWLR